MKKTLLILTFLLSVSVYADDCVKTKAAFDIGSGATKLKVARVDVCLQKIKEVLLDTSEPVAYKEALLSSQSNAFDSKIRARGLEALKKLKAEAQRHKPASYIAVATSAFRTSANGKIFAKQLSAKTGIPIKMVDQDLEAKIGFAGAAGLATKEAKDIMVWDIGAGSMQMTAYDKKGRFHIYRGKAAAASFAKHLIGEVQGANPKTVKSPNPIAGEEARIGERDAYVVAKLSVPDEIKKKVASGAEVIGIGGVHSYSIRYQAGVDQAYTLSDVERALDKQMGKSDRQIGGKYASTEVSNLILVKGFMEGLGIKKVRVGTVNLADGLLLGGGSLLK